jgi:hypothetical protein
MAYKLCSTLAAAAVALSATTARAEEPPTGLSWLVAGGLVTGAGSINLVGAPLCMATLPSAQHVPCAATSIAFGLAGLGVGIPLLVVGAGKRAAWVTWEQEHLTVAPSSSGALVGWKGAF